MTPARLIRKVLMPELPERRDYIGRQDMKEDKPSLQHYIAQQIEAELVARAVHLSGNSLMAMAQILIESVRYFDKHHDTPPA